MAFACALHLLGSNYNTVKKSRGEVLLFKDCKGASVSAQDSSSSQILMPQNKMNEKTQQSVHDATVALCWNKVAFDVKAGKAYKKILYEIDGWIEHGTLTALMVCSFSVKGFPR